MLFTLVVFAVMSRAICVTSDREVERHQVIVVGAGVSGFTAAATLLEHNVTDVLVLEASDRIGGRIQTVQFGGVPIDKGAEFVRGQAKNAVYELVSPFNLLTSYEPLVTSDHRLFVNTHGQVLDSSFASNILEKAKKLLDGDNGTALINGSILETFSKRYEEILRTYNVDHAVGEGIRHIVLVREGENTGEGDLALLGARQVRDHWTTEGDIHLKWKTGGYKTLFDIISKNFPNPNEELPVVNKTVLGKQVTRVERREEDVEVTCTDGSTYLADHLIVTVSLGVLKKHAATMFHPALPAEKTAAIEKLGIGCVGKVFLLFPNRWWPEDINLILPLLSDIEIEELKIHSVYGHWSYNTSTFSQVMNHERMLCAWFSGQACRTMESFTDEQIVDALMEFLGKLVADKYNITRPESILRSGWGSNPYTLGAYSYYTLETDRANITNAILAEPIIQGGKPVVLFAGEATHPHYFSTVHGALETGRREAHRIVNYLKTDAK